MAKKTRAEVEKEDTSGGTIAVNDAWTGMLVISFLALILGASFLTWDWWRYSKEPPGVQKFTGSQPGQPPAVNLPKGDDKQPPPPQDKQPPPPMQDKQPPPMPMPGQKDASLRGLTDPLVRSVGFSPHIAAARAEARTTSEDA